MVQYAAGQGIYSFVFLGPQTAYGRQIETALRTEAFNVGGTVLTSAFYMPETGPTEAARSVSGITVYTSFVLPGRRRSHLYFANMIQHRVYSAR